MIDGNPGRARREKLTIAAIAVPDCRPIELDQETRVGTKKSGKGRRKVGRKKRRMRARIRHRKG